MARNTAGVDSDLDLAVSADRPLDAHEKMQLIMDLAEITGPAGGPRGSLYRRRASAGTDYRRRAKNTGG